MKWKSIHIERVYKSGPQEINMQIDKMFENLSQVPTHHKKLFERKCKEDKFFSNINTLLKSQRETNKENLVQVKRRFDLEQNYLNRINLGLRKTQGNQSKGTLPFEFDDKKRLNQMKQYVQNIGYIYICQK
jgi:hypothetical protein